MTGLKKYIISYPQYDGEYKVGIAKYVESRLNLSDLIFSDPDRSYKIEYNLPIF